MAKSSGSSPKCGTSLRDERQRNSDVAAEHVTHGQKNDGTVRLFAQRRILRDHGIGGGKMPAVGDERTFRMTGGAGRVDDEGGIFGRQR